MTKKKDNKRAICDAAIKLANKHPWASLTLSQISKEAKVPLAQTKKFYSKTSDVLVDLIKATDREVELLANVSREDSARDRLFEILMTRFDVLQKKRKSILSIAHACKKDPDLLRIIFTAQFESMRKTLALAELNSETTNSIAKILGIFAVYQFTLHQWMNDDSKDMSKTMAALDKFLGKAHMAAVLLGYSQ